MFSFYTITDICKIYFQVLRDVPRRFWILRLLGQVVQNNIHAGNEAE